MRIGTLEHDRKAREHSLRRRAGKEPAEQERVQAALAKCDDWWGECRYCGNRVSGHPSALAGPCRNCGAGASAEALG